MKTDFKLIDLIVRLICLGLIFYWCFLLFRPLVTLIVWGAILGVTWFPLFLRIKAVVGGRAKLATVLLTLISILIIAGPVSAIALVLVGNLQTLADNLLNQSIVLPSPEIVSSWPVIGQPLNAILQVASVNIGELSTRFEPQLKELAKTSLLVAGNTSVTLLKFILSIIIAGVLTLYNNEVKDGVIRFSERIAPGWGGEFLKLSVLTVRNVARGVIGVAIVQSLLIGIGLIVAGIPAAGLLTFLCLVLALIQIGPMLIVLPVLIFAWSTMNNFWALIFTLWMLPSALIDNFLKPIWMARGLPVPMPVIIIGVFGGVLTHGFIGLFVGPVILSLGYELIKAWLNQDLILKSTPADENS
ncbi:AI-2E family transporter [Gloeocapsa sp. PCC 73106]|uniref:AI-2E family transporter n=1 Tax=Gloeocapsa sp. PCC 73106 TaxID=102232 RepID=UPI0002ABE9E3|nr:AI-2E family transporter [Gloeocapsa sp. PCC 73106]ELR96216.1 putative permease [Gloeocapsa sp. PCC 73106]